MIAQYVKERGYAGAGVDPHLTLGKKYDVFTISFFSEQGHEINEIIVRSDQDGTPAVFPLSCFQIVDGKIPSDWTIEQHDFENYRIQPKEFNSDFWRDFHDGEEVSQRIFKDACLKIKIFHEPHKCA